MYCTVPDEISNQNAKKEQAIDASSKIEHGILKTRISDIYKEKAPRSFSEVNFEF